MEWKANVNAAESTFMFSFTFLMKSAFHARWLVIREVINIAAKSERNDFLPDKSLLFRLSRSLFGEPDSHSYSGKS